MSFVRLTLISWIWSTICSALLHYKLIETYRHDDGCFTQGLLISEDGRIIYESCGQFRKSKIVTMNIATGSILRTHKFEDNIFIEGIALVDDRLFAATWTNKKIFILNATTLERIESLKFRSSNGQGWGLTFDGKALIMSDGSPKLTFFAVPAPESKPGPSSLSRRLQKVGEIIVKAKNGQVISNINELEYVNGYIFANIWYDNHIIQIDPRTGLVVDAFDLESLYPPSQRTTTSDCLNGIAFNETSQTFILTGKLWPEYFHVKLTAKMNATGRKGAAEL